MARPSHTELTSGEEDWDGDVNDNFALVFETPLPVAEYTSGTLPTANAYDHCIAYDTTKNRPVFSNSSEWRDLETRRKNLSSKTSDYTIVENDDIILVDCTSGAVTITLPSAVGLSGKSYVIKKIDASGNAVTVDGQGSETIDGSGTKSLSSQWDYVKVISDGVNFLIIG